MPVLLRWLAVSVVVVVLLLCRMPMPAGAQGTLLSISSDPSSDPVTGAALTFLRRLDPATGQTLSSVAITMVNPPPPLAPNDPTNTFVLTGNGLAAHPQTGQLFAVLTVASEFFADDPLLKLKRHLATLDPGTGRATLIGDTGKLAGLAFTTGGALGAGVLLGVMGDGASGAFCPPQPQCVPRTLYQLALTDAHATRLKDFGTTGAGEAIAFDPVDLRVYHASGSGSGDTRVFESIDLAALAGPTTPIPLSGFAEGNPGDEITALTFAQGVFFAADVGQNFLTITPAGVVTNLGTLDHKSKGLVFLAGPPPTTLVAAILPSSRSVQVPTAATAFATIINSGPNTAFGVGISLASVIPASFTYNATDCATNAVTGADNAPVNIAAGAPACFVISITPSAAFDPTEVAFSFAGVNTAPVATLVAINTLLMSASLTPVPDIVALAATVTNDGIVHVPGPTGTGAFAVATSNVGAGGLITVSANPGAAVLPVTISLCRTDPILGTCISAIGPSVTVQMSAAATSTFGIFVTATGAIPLDPANSRVFVVFQDAGAVTRGRTSVAVQTQ